MKKAAATFILGTIGIFGTFHALVALMDRHVYFDCHETVVTVQAGDTVWDIADTYCDGHTGFASSAIVDKYGATIHPGQTIVLP